MKYILLYVLASFLLLTIWGTVPAATADKKESVERIATNAFRESCFKANPSMTIEVEFISSIPVNFNLHYHDSSNNVVYPIRKINISDYTGSYKPTSDARFCFMWRNRGDETARVSFAYSLVKK